MKPLAKLQRWWKHGSKSDDPCPYHPEAPDYGPHEWRPVLVASVLTGIPGQVGHRCSYCEQRSIGSGFYAQQMGAIAMGAVPKAAADSFVKDKDIHG